MGNCSERNNLNKKLKINYTKKDLKKEKDNIFNASQKNIIQSKSFINRNSFIYQKKNNLSSFFNSLEKKNKNTFINSNEIMKGKNKILFTNINNNSMNHLDVKKIKDITISDKNLKIYKVNNLESEEYFDNSKDIIKENIKENKNDNFISKCNIYKGKLNNFNQNRNNRINYNNQNYIDNINIIGYVKNVNDERITYNLNSPNNRNINNNNNLENNIKYFKFNFPNIFSIKKKINKDY